MLIQHAGVDYPHEGEVYRTYLSAYFRERVFSTLAINTYLERDIDGCNNTTSQLFHLLEQPVTSHIIKPSKKIALYGDTEHFVPLSDSQLRIIGENFKKLLEEYEDYQLAL